MINNDFIWLIRVGNDCNYSDNYWWFVVIMVFIMFLTMIYYDFCIYFDHANSMYRTMLTAWYVTMLTAWYNCAMTYNWLIVAMIFLPMILLWFYGDLIMIITN